MRDACLELVTLLGLCPIPALEVYHRNMAMRYLFLAADLAERCQTLEIHLATTVADATLPSTALPPALLEELSDHASGVVAKDPAESLTTARAVRLLLSLSREQAADPVGLSDASSQLGVTLHRALAAHCPAYAD